MSGATADAGVSRPIRRRVLHGLLILLGILAVLSVASYANRRLLLEIVAIRSAGALGIEHISLTVEEADSDFLRLSNLTIGSPKILSARSVDLDYSLIGLLLDSPRLDSLRLVGAELDIGYGSAGFEWGALAPLLDRPGRQDGDRMVEDFSLDAIFALPVEKAAWTDLSARIRGLDWSGKIVSDGDATLADGNATLAGRAELSIDRGAEAIRATIDLTATLDDERRLESSIRLEESEIRIPASPFPDMKATGEFRISLTEDRAKIESRIGGTADGSGVKARFSSIVALLADDPIAGGAFTIDGSLSSAATADAEPNPTGGELAMRASISGRHPGAVAFPSSQTAMTAFALAAPLNWSASIQARDLTLDTRVAGLKADIALEGAFYEKQGVVEAEIRTASTPASIQVDEIASTLFHRFGAPSIALAGGSFSALGALQFADISNPKQLEASLKTTGSVATLETPWFPAGAISISGRVSAQSWEDHEFKASVRDAEIRIDSLDLVGQTVNLDLGRSGAQNPLTVELTGARIAGLGPKPAIAPIDLQASASVSGDRFDVRTLTAAAAATPIVDAVGSFDSATQTGVFRLRPTILEFEIRGLQPKALFPEIGGLFQDTLGKIRYGGRLSYRDGRIDGPIEIALDDLSATILDTRMSGLNGVLTLTGLSPFAMAREQRIGVSLTSTPIPVTDLLVRFRLPSSDFLTVDEARLSILSGEMSLDPTVYRFDANANDLMLRIDDLSLPALLEFTTLDGLDAKGQLSGGLPIRIAPEDWAIEGGKLTSSAAGIFHYAPEASPLSLSQGGEIALQALSDFRYKALEMTVDRKFGGESRVGLQLKGSNPTFYNGYPVELNIDLTGKLIEALTQGLRGRWIVERIGRALPERIGSKLR